MVVDNSPSKLSASRPLGVQGWMEHGREEALMVLEGDWGFITLNSGIQGGNNFAP